MSEYDEMSAQRDIHLQPLGIGKPRTVQVAELEAELSDLWRGAAESPDASGAVTRACALTLLVYVESSEAEAEVSAAVSQITLQNPCRVIVMVAEPEVSTPSLEARVSAQCHLPVAGEKQVCCEQVAIWARGREVHSLDNVVVPLTVPGLPVFLWWRAGRFAPASYFDQILRVTDRVLVDSARFASAEEDLVSLAHVIERYSGDLTFSDLNWARTMPWRELVAQCFEPSEMRPYLQSLCEARLECGPRPDGGLRPSSQCLLLAGWLASRLAWRPTDRIQPEPGATGHFLPFQSGGRQIKLGFAEARGAGVPGPGLTSIRLMTGDIPPATFSLERSPDGKCLLARSEIPGRGAAERAVPFELAEEAVLVNEDLKWANRDLVYEQALAKIASITA